MPYGEGEGLEFERGELVDCSPHGIGLILGRSLIPGASFLLKLNLKPVAFAVYDVRNCSATGNGFRIGASFHGFIGSPARQQPDAATICALV